jgi:hypothetical protein
MDMINEMHIEKYLVGLFIHFGVNPEKMTLKIDANENDVLLDIAKNNKQARDIILFTLTDCISALACVMIFGAIKNQIILDILSKLDKLRKQLLTFNKNPNEVLTSEEFEYLVNKARVDIENAIKNIFIVFDKSAKSKTTTDLDL